MTDAEKKTNDWLLENGHVYDKERRFIDGDEYVYYKVLYNDYTYHMTKQNDEWIYFHRAL